MEIVMNSLKNIASDIEVSSEAMDIDEVIALKDDFKDLIVAQEWEDARNLLHKIQMSRMDSSGASRKRNEIYRECSLVHRNSRRWATETEDGVCGICEHESPIGDNGVCMWCLGLHYRECGYCASVHPEDSLQERRGKLACEECAEKYVTCPNCGRDMERDSLDWEGALDLCYQCGREQYIQPYNFERSLNSGDFKKLSSEDKVVFFGIEAEVDGGKDFGSAIMSLRDLRNSIGPFWDLVHDGSLREGKGFEIVSVPASWRFHVDEFPWEEIFEICKSAQYKSDNVKTTGLHIHAGRNVIKDSTASNANLFVSANPAFVQRIARRKDTRGYAKFKSLREARNDGCNSKERYEAVNFRTGGKSTIEFRMFQGTIIPDVLYGSIEFVRSLLEFCSEHEEDEVTNDAVERYLDWIDHDKFIHLSNLL